MRNVDKTSCEVTGVSRFKSGVRKTFSSAVRRDEVFQNRQAFTERRADRQLDGTTGRVCHKTTHTCELTDLSHATTSTGVCHHPNRVEVVKTFFEFALNLVCGVFPNLDDFFVTAFVGEDASCMEFFDADDLFFRFVNDELLVTGDVHIENGCGDCTDCRILVAERFDLVEHLCRFGCSVIFEAVVNDHAELLLADSHSLLAEHFLDAFAKSRDFTQKLFVVGDVEIACVFDCRRDLSDLLVRDVSL